MTTNEGIHALGFGLRTYEYKLTTVWCSSVSATQFLSACMSACLPRVRELYNGFGLQSRDPQLRYVIFYSHPKLVNGYVLRNIYSCVESYLVHMNVRSLRSPDIDHVNNCQLYNGRESFYQLYKRVLHMTQVLCCVVHECTGSDC